MFLLDVSATFGTIDHYVLQKRVACWFGITGSALNWINSYPTSQSFHVQVKDSQFFVFQLLYDVLRGCILGPLLLILYLTPFSTVIINVMFIIICVLLLLSSSFLFRLNSSQTFQFLKRLLLKSAPGCLQIFSFLIHLKLISYVNNFLKLNNPSLIVHHDVSSFVASACILGMKLIKFR
jgi:hypothetical protein